MTSYYIDKQGHRHRATLPPSLAPSTYVPIPELADWEAGMAGKYVYCAKCQTPVLSSEWPDHLATVHPPGP